MSNVTVSVIIRTPAPNSWLEEALASVLRSSVAVEVVAVINDPNYNDDIPTTSLLNDARVKVLAFKKRLGPTAAMLAGIEASTGELLACLDADDRALPLKFEQQVDYLASHSDCVLVGTRATRIDEAGKVTGEISSVSGEDIRQHLLLFNPVVHSSVMYRKSAYVKAGGYDPKLIQMEDYDLILRIARLGKVAILPERLLEYRIHSNQTSRGARPRGAHIRAIAGARRLLARHLSVPASIALVQHLIWRTAQFARWYRIIKPGHEY